MPQLIDPLAGTDAQPQAQPLVDPLGGWTPDSTAAPQTPAAAPRKSILATSYNSLPTRENPQGDEWNKDSDIAAIRSAFPDAYYSFPQSVTNPGARSVFSPQTQESMRTGWLGGWPGAAVNAVGDTLGTGVATLAGAGNAAMVLGNKALESFGVPPVVQRDLNVAATDAPFNPGYRLPVPYHPDDVAALRELTKPPTPTLSDVWQQQRAATPPDPQTSAIIDMLRRNQPQPNIPAPPTPFQGAPSQPPSGGLLGVGAPPPTAGLLAVPQGGPAPVMSADEILARAQGYYSPADKQAAQGAMINSDAANGIRKVLTDAVPTDPQKAVATGNTPLVQLGIDYGKFTDQPMSYDTAMALDRRLTTEKQAALRSGNNTLASQIGSAQDAIRDKVQSLTPGDTTGDPATLANLPNARQSYTQYVKQQQVEDLQYNASLLPDSKQDAYIRSRATAMLRGNASRNWTGDERAAWENVAQSGNINPLVNLGITLIKPVAQAGGGYIGSAFGPGGTFVGSQVGGELALPLQAKLRAALSRVSLTPVSQQISAGVPPIPPAPP